MKIETIIIRMLIITIFSGLIGFERERRNSHASVKTIMVVGLAACLIAILQQYIVIEVMSLHKDYATVATSISNDPSRLIGQVVTGIGFLGGGTIIVTKRNISGLTTAAAIWITSAVGLTVGMGFYKLSLTAIVFYFIIVGYTKYLYYHHYKGKIQVVYKGGKKTLETILDEFEKHNYTTIHQSYSIDAQNIYTSIIEIKGRKLLTLHEMSQTMMNYPEILSIEEDNID